MKYLFSILIFFISCSVSEKQPLAPVLEQYFTLEQVRTIAAKYDLEDMVDPVKSNGLMYQTPEDLERYFVYHKEIRDKIREEQILMEKIREGVSYDEFVALIDQLPALRRSRVRAYDRTDNESRYQEEIQEFRKNGISHVYVDAADVINYCKCTNPDAHKK
jgi:hypothetical protein